MTQSARVIRLKNTLTGQEDKLEVPGEETVGEIRRRYLEINGHAQAYGMKSLVINAKGEWICKELNLRKTLEENGIPNEAFLFEQLDLEPDFYTPVILTYWMDDLTCL